MRNDNALSKSTSLRGPKKKEILLYYGRVDGLQWDPGRMEWNWKGGTPIMNYTTNMGRLMLKRHHTVPPVIKKKWEGILPQSFKLRWLNT